MATGGQVNDFQRKNSPTAAADGVAFLGSDLRRHSLAGTSSTASAEKGDSFGVLHQDDRVQDANLYLSASQYNTSSFVAELDEPVPRATPYSPAMVEAATNLEQRRAAVSSNSFAYEDDQGSLLGGNKANKQAVERCQGNQAQASEDLKPICFLLSQDQNILVQDMLKTLSGFSGNGCTPPQILVKSALKHKVFRTIETPVGKYLHCR